MSVAPPSPLPLPGYNPLGINYRLPVPRPKVRGPVIDWHTHLLAARHADDWFAAADHFGIDTFLTMTPLEEAVGLQRRWGHRLHFIAIPRWQDLGQEGWADSWLRRVEAFHNLGSRVIKFHMAPGTMARLGATFRTPAIRQIMDEAKARGMIFMSHVGDPDIWYRNKYADGSKFNGSRDDHYLMWEEAMGHVGRDRPWVGAHLGGNPEDLGRLQGLLDRWPNLYLDLSATRWMVREVSARRDAAREFVLRNADRLLFGSDQVSGDDRGFDFLASRFYAHRKLWETAHVGQVNIVDPDFDASSQPVLRGLALPDDVLQKVYHDNAVRLMEWAGIGEMRNAEFGMRNVKTAA